MILAAGRRSPIFVPSTAGSVVDPRLVALEQQVLPASWIVDDNIRFDPRFDALLRRMGLDIEL